MEPVKIIIVSDYVICVCVHTVASSSCYCYSDAVTRTRFSSAATDRGHSSRE